MANVRDSDTSLWLHNKLGISNDSWTGGSICSQLNVEVLRNIKDCFPDLQTQVKLKLLLSFFHIPRRNLEEWKSELESILDVAVQDSELWVAMLAEALKTYPSTGSLNTEISDLEEVKPIVTDLVNDLRKLIRKQLETVMLPMECHYLNKSALVSVVGNRPEPLKHFTLRKKQKSAVLRTELLQKSMDAASNLKKSSAPVVPVRSRGMPRKMTDTTPLKGIPSRVPTSGFRPISSSLNNRLPTIRPPAGRKEGGVKMLDIADQPVGFATAKKRKRLQEMESAKKAATEANTVQSPPATTGSTPDHASNLSTAPTYAPAPQPTVQPTATPATPQVTAQPTVVVPVSQVQSAITVQTATALPTATQFSTTTSLRPVPPLLATTPLGQRTIVADQQTFTVVGQIPTPNIVTQRPMQNQSTVTHIRIHTPQQPASALQKRGLALTREQMLEAQDMFRTANKVTRPEKALILGFMAGSRDNPCPHLGNIVTIKLSEDQENVQQSDETYLTMMVETHFQMNYNNGEWKRIKKYRHIENMVEPVSQNNQATAYV
ncbi:negative elongation factor A [Harmonia axyridis]|uniref:negative elongation factor A n=1 Tax=Harmonia axyridis TaxID=115357 RepID=UPI001E276F8C|nr:negative elongation factor A [Harmonia axyridis]